MSNMSGSKPGGRSLGTIIGLVASIITICVFCTGIQSVQQLVHIALPTFSFPINFSTHSLPGVNLPVKVGQWTGHIMFIYGDDVAEFSADGQVSPLFVAPKGAAGLRWAPDGRHIAYVANDVNGTPSIFVVNSDGTNARTFTPPYHNGTGIAALTWFPDSLRLLFSAQAYGFGMVDTQSASITPLGMCEDPNSLINVGPSAIALDSQGATLAFYDFLGNQIMVRPTLTAKCTTWLAPSDLELSDYTPLVFSKDGNQLLFYTSTKLYWLNAPGNAATRTLLLGIVADSAVENPTAMSWSPDGRYIAVRKYQAISIVDTTTGAIDTVFHDNGKFGDTYSLGWLP